MSSFDNWAFVPILGLHVSRIYAVFIIKNVVCLHSTTWRWSEILISRLHELVSIWAQYFLGEEKNIILM
jgi:hypothetical protein